MAALPSGPSATVAAIYDAYERKQETGYREHLGASLIGTECERALWYGFRWTTRATFKGRLLRLFETGHQAEGRFVANLRATGVTVLEFNEGDPEEYLANLYVPAKQWDCRDETGHFGGSGDGVAIGVIEAPKTWHLCEFKTHNAKSFKKLESDGVQKAKPLHYAQMQTYMHLMGLERALYVAVNKDSDELYSERIPYDLPTGVKMVAKAGRVINAPVPPSKLSADPAWFACRICDHAPACHGTTVPERHCRSCLHSSPVADGKWHCDKHDVGITREEQIQGCPDHLYIPDFIHGEQIDLRQNGELIVYRMPDGSEWIDGIPHDS